ncbi:hypothetical protein [Hymenobacter edaphi]|uniref:Uncharacterized protein n=1 Tax=Hymenobacter edaphi TaxID=2211146 RepID=A0A328BRK5_9BACT|nr:hypothetical protein [Hymenobacter edaphi]RAK69693.1 hypothetical protein DLM85_02220 [Hymenobacter edaphi]
MRSALTVASLVVLVVGLGLWALFYLASSPRQWTAQVPGQAALSIRVEVQNLGFRDDHDRTAVLLEYDPWFGMGYEKELGTFDSQQGGPYHPTGFKFDWLTHDSLHIYAKVEGQERLLTIVIPSKRSLLSPHAVEQVRRNP